MIIKSAEFVLSAENQSHYPDPLLPEIAFLGRSNVGKSSLINSLMKRRRLAKTSSTPGRTRLINFFVVNGALGFVDLPGFGYARVPEEIQRRWRPMVETYLLTRKTLKGVILIIDTRRTPGTEEIDLLAWLAQQTLPRILVITKTDKVSKSVLSRQRAIIARTLSVDPEDLIPFSSKTGLGRESIWEAVSKLLSADHPGESSI
jgi:GTP-binding protein